MNCKQGDFAIVVRSVAGNEGKIVRCIELTFGDGLFGYGPRWATEPGLCGWRGTQNFPVADSALRPIVGVVGEDEMLRIAGIHIGVPQAA